MESKENEAVIAFDTLYTNNHIQILKILLPHFDSKGRKHLAILIKFMELRYTMEYFSRHMPETDGIGEEHREAAKQPDIVKIFEQIKIFCTPSERAMFDQLANIKKSMEMYEEMTNMMQLFSQLMPEEEGAANGYPGQNEFTGQVESAERNEAAARDEADGQDEAAQRNGAAARDEAAQRHAASGQSPAPAWDANPMDMLKGMLSPEQQAMFEMFRSSLGNTN